MEGAIKPMALKGSLSLVLPLFFAISFTELSDSQELPTGSQVEEKGQLRLRKTVKTRDYQGKAVEGEERVVGAGDSLWRILIQEKGLSEKRFGRYLLLIGSLNPDLKRLDVLRVGDTIFIPTRPDEILGIQLVSGKAETKVYRVKRGDYLYKILRQQFGIQEEKQIHSAVSQVKELNPRKKNWNLLLVGEAILFPGKVSAPSVAAAPTVKPAAESVEIVGLDYGRKLPVGENLALLSQVVGALGSETNREGEETLPLQEGMIRIDRNVFPIIHNPKLARKVVLDLEGKMPASIRANVEAQGAGTGVVPVKKGASLHEAANSLLSHLGFQSLPQNQPIVIQDAGVGLQVKGEWMVTTPEESGGRQEIWIISLTDLAGKSPDYLTEYLSLKGMNLKEILIPFSPVSVASPSSGSRGQGATGQLERWPADKIALVDAFLQSYQISFSNDREISLSLREGIRMDTKVDRFFEFGGKKFALIFRPAGVDVKKGLEEKEGVRAVELDLSSLSSRNLISRLLDALGERAVYREHRFPAGEGGGRDRVVLTVHGFFLAHRSMLLTDREIPKGLELFFGEKGLRVIYFQ